MGHRILVAFDESSQATAALHHALSMYPEAEIEVLHVTDPQEWVFGDSMGGGYYSEDVHELARKSAAELLETAKMIANEYDRDIATTIETGRAGVTIVSYARDNEIGHIVMGSHGRRGISRFLLGSVAETVVERSPVSVTIIREPNPAE